MLDSMRHAGRVNVSAIEWGFAKAVPGTTLREIDAEMEQYIRKAGCTPAFKDYQPAGAPSPFPASACISPNDVVVHGVPGDYVIQAGDLLTIDVGTEYNGWFVDAARSRVIPGAVNEPATHLVKATELILEAQLNVIKNGCNLLELALVSEKVAKDLGVVIMPQWGGHSIGQQIHLDPFIPSSIDRSKSSTRQKIEESQYRRQILTTGQTICIEPVVTYENTVIMIDEDGWTIRKADKTLTAHTERCLVVTEDGYELLS